MLVYTPKITKRIKYTFNLIFRTLLNTEFRITSSINEFKAYEGVKINYSQHPIDDELFFQAVRTNYDAPFLYDTGIKEQFLTFINYNNSKAFFPTNHNKSAMPFDPFAASFYLVSRYEEYLPFIKDKYDRFDASESIAIKNHFLQEPVVNVWSMKIANIIKEHYPAFTYRKNFYKYIPTIDIDLFYAYKLKGLSRTLGGFIKSLTERDYKGIAERSRVISGVEKDPFDTYEFQMRLHKQHNLSPVYFILVADYAQFDKNISHQNRKFQALIKSLSDQAEIGIHPSYASNHTPDKLRIEINRLSKILNKEITKSRQHFLKLTLPHTYRNLLNHDITDDFTMGYASEPGFRAGICSPFNFYDLDLDTETNLTIHPFTLMEGTLRDYRNIMHADAMEHIKPLIKRVKEVNGTFMTLWHNESLSNQKRWVGWDKVYEEIVELVRPNS